MSNSRGGRRIKFVIWEYAYPHSDSAKKNGVGQEFPIYQGEYQRPIKAFAAMLNYWGAQINRAFTENIEPVNKDDAKKKE